MSTCLRASLEITFLPAVNDRVYRRVIKKVSLSVSLGRQFSIIRVPTDDRGQMKTLMNLSYRSLCFPSSRLSPQSLGSISALPIKAKPIAEM